MAAKEAINNEQYHLCETVNYAYNPNLAISYLKLPGYFCIVHSAATNGRHMHVCIVRKRNNLAIALFLVEFVDDHDII